MVQALGNQPDVVPLLPQTEIRVVLAQQQP
ncbi:MAG: hypothetical protein ACD_75C01784G0001, partial [uncultured bacterium]